MHYNKTVILIDNSDTAVQRVDGSPFWLLYTFPESIRNVSKMKVEFLYLDAAITAPTVLIQFPKAGPGVFVPYATATGSLVAQEINFDLPVSLFSRVEARLATSDGELLAPTGADERVVLLLTVYHTVRDEAPLVDLQMKKEDSKIAVVDHVNTVSFVHIPKDPIRNQVKLRLLSFETLDPEYPNLVTLSSRGLRIEWPLVPNAPCLEFFETRDLPRDFSKFDIEFNPPLSTYSLIFEVTYANT